MKIYELPKTRVLTVSIPFISLTEGELVRVEMGFCDYALRKAIAQCMEKNAVQANLHPIRPLQTQNSLFKLFKPWKVTDYFKAVGLTEDQKQNFFAMADEFSETIKTDSLLQELRPQQRQVVFLYAMICYNMPIFIYTSGFYVSILALAYEIIKWHRMQGSTCMELTYPLFQQDDSLRAVIIENPRTIVLG